MAGSRSSQRSTVSSRSTTPHAASSGTNSGANFGGSSAPASPSFLSRAFPALAASVLALTAVVFAFTYSRPSLGRCDLLQLQLLGRKQGDDLGKHLKVLEKQMNYNKKLVGALQASLAKLTAADSAAAAEADTSAPADVAIPGNASTRQLVELAARQVADEVRASMEETQVAEGGKGGGGGRRRRLAGGVMLEGRGGREGGGGGETVGAGRLNGGESGGGRAADGDWDRMEGGEMEEWEVPQELGSEGEESVGEDERRAGGRRRLLMSRDEWPRVTYLFRGKMAHQRHPEVGAGWSSAFDACILLTPLHPSSPLFTPLHPSLPHSTPLYPSATLLPSPPLSSPLHPSPPLPTPSGERHRGARSEQQVPRVVQAARGAAAGFPHYERWGARGDAWGNVERGMLSIGCWVEWEHIG
ncbi:unnamed protein product [Closterium sp. NIES-53]